MRGPADVAAADAAVAHAAAHMGRTMDTDGIRDLLLANLDHPRWDDVADRCLTCGNCTMVCPTCFCTTVEDVSDLTAASAEHTQRWDSCFTMDFSYIHGGSVRASPKSRYRQWMTHKLGDLDRPVRHLRLRRLRPLHHLVPGRHRHHRGGARHPRRIGARDSPMIEGMESIVREHRFFADLDEATIKLLAGCARNVRFNAGEYLFRTGEPADEFYLIRHGRVALEVVAPGREAVVIQTASEGEIVGVSWLLPPYRWTYDARAVDQVRAIGMDAKCLRGKCDADHDLGYEMMLRFVPLLVSRLQATRMQLLDVYGKPA